MGYADAPSDGLVRRDLLAVGASAAALAVGLGQGAAIAQPAAPGGASTAPGKIEVERRGQVLLVSLARPEAQNRLDPPMLVALGEAYYQLERDDDLRVAVLHGDGPDFCLGIDGPAYASALRAGTYPPKDPNIINPFATQPPARSKPVVVAVQGGTWGAGHELFLAADVRVASRDAHFRDPSVTLGVFPAAGATVRFTREAGWGNAMRYLLTGDPWSADDAYRLGVVQEVTDPGEQLDRAIGIAQKIAAAAPLGVRATLASSHAAISGEDDALLALSPEFRRLLRKRPA
jgi:enoyl-CoA hydratase